jgi:hypothetical protein
MKKIRVLYGGSCFMFGSVFVQPIALAALYSHPVECLISNTLAGAT